MLHISILRPSFNASLRLFIVFCAILACCAGGCSTAAAAEPKSKIIPLRPPAQRAMLQTPRPSAIYPAETQTPPPPTTEKGTPLSSARDNIATEVFVFRQSGGNQFIFKHLYICHMDLKIETLTADRLIASYEKLGYPVFTQGAYNINLFGILANGGNPNRYNDFIGLFFHERGSSFTPDNWRFHLFPATLNPGLPFLLSPMDGGGAAIICEGYYRGLWEISTFKGTPCLRQRTPVKIYRDNNRDDKLDLNPKTTTEGFYGLLMHEHFQTKDRAEIVANSSAGCHVPQRRSDMQTIMKICNLGVVQWGNKISYGVLNEKQIV